MEFRNHLCMSYEERRFKIEREKIMYRKNKFIKVFIISLFTIFAFVSCSNEQKITDDNVEVIAEVEKEEKKDNEDNIDNEGTEEPIMREDKEVDKVIEIDVETPPLPIRDIPSTELIKELKIGWNLGNTFDATGGSLLSSEVSWGNPITKEEMFIAVKEAGFNIIRIPVSWGNHMGPEPDYTIHTAWLDRVNEVVDYAIDNDLYVILNLHHEEWHFPSYENLDKANQILEKVWLQIAERFKNYDEHLIFEGMNEPRMKNTPLEWTGGNAEAWDVINQLNHTFVDTIRNSGGNNPYRHLMIPPYAASSDPKTWSEFIVPEDDKIIVSIHAYTPYNFALNTKGTDKWSLENSRDTGDIDYLMNNIYNTFISKGQPVIIGEFGAVDKENLEDRKLWSEYYIQKASEKGIPCIWWDNGAFVGGGELFGILDRRSGDWKFPDIVEALMRGLE